MDIAAARFAASADPSRLAAGATEKAPSVAAARFAELMGTPEAASSGTAGAAADTMPPGTPAPAAPGTPAPAAPATLGDAILSGLRGASRDMSSAVGEVSRTLDARHMSLGDMLKVQLHLVQMSVQFELVGKAIGKCTQNIDQLVKLQ